MFGTLLSYLYNVSIFRDQYQFVLYFVNMYYTIKIIKHVYTIYCIYSVFDKMSKENYTHNYFRE